MHVSYRQPASSPPRQGSRVGRCEQITCAKTLHTFSSCGCRPGSIPDQEYAFVDDTFTLDKSV